MTTANEFIQANITTFINNNTLHHIIPHIQKYENNTITKELNWLIDRCDNRHDGKTFEGTLPDRMVTASKKLGDRFTVFGDGVVYTFNLSFGCYVSNQNKIHFSYESQSFNDFFGC